MSWQSVALGTVLPFRYGKGLPARDRTESGDYSVVSSAGHTGSHSVPLTTGPSVVIGRKGTIGATYFCPEPVWPIDTVFYVEPSDSIDVRFAYYLLSALPLKSMNNDSAVPGLNRAHAESLQVLLPPIEEQRAIAATLGALDDKIESNQRARRYLRSLGDARFRRALEQGEQNRALHTLTLSIARGVSPKYADGDPSAALVINQKCIRDGWVSLQPARRMHERTVAPEKRAASGDILVNSTGVGTLGRVARWHDGDVFIDSHVSVVKPDPNEIEPVLLAYALLGRQEDIEALATGSTGQTELSPTRLGSLSVSIPTGASLDLAEALIAIERRADQLASEILRLTSLRDTLLPELLSGRIRVPAEGVAA